MKIIVMFSFLLCITINVFSQDSAEFKMYKQRVMTDGLDCGEEVIILSIKADNVKAYYQAYVDYAGYITTFFQGNLNGTLISGNKITTQIFEGQDQGTRKEKFKIEFINGKLNVDDNPDLIERVDLNYSFNWDGFKNFRELPNTSSKVITKINTEKSKILLLEIGSVETISNKIDFWYKVNLNEAIGWIFGGLSINQ